MIAEAYEVLTDDEKRRIYDAYGHAGVDTHEHGAQPPTASARTHGFQEDYGFRHAQHIFESFFGGRNPFAAMNQHMMRGMPGFGNGEEDDFFGGPGFGMTSSFFFFGGGGGGLFGQSSRSLFDNPAAPFSGGGGGFGGSSFAATATSSSFSSSSSRSFGGGGASSRHERTFVRFGLDGTRRSVRETTVMHADGRREVQVEEEQVGPPQQEGRLEGPS